MDSMSSPQTR
jgi:hypothetical protein